MSTKNDDNSTIGVVLGLMVAGMLAIFLVIFALLAFLSFVMTIASLFAWNKPLKIGTIVIEPEEARAFVARGIAGAVLVPAFLVFVTVFLGVHIEWEYFFHFVLAGYVGGSIGIELLLSQGDQQTAAAEYLSPAPQLAKPAPPVAARPQADPFRFASWDDEEAQR